MDQNPYSSPQAVGNATRPGGTIQFQVFRAKAFALNLSWRSLRDVVRHRVQRAVDEEIGAENVISIQEHDSSFTGFSIVVWYRQL